MSTVKGSNGREVDARGSLCGRATINVLLDDVLIEVFSFYLDLGELYAWHTLVHVSRRWRQLVFASPCRLNLRVLCTNRTSMKKLLDIWPALPIVIKGHDTLVTTDFDKALEHNNRVCEIEIEGVSSRLLDLMIKPFPELTNLKLVLRSYDNMAPVLSDSFLGGSAPRLRNLRLNNVPFLGLPKLLSSTHHLVDLRLYDIPDSGYISPEAMVSGLSSLTNLKKFALGFQSPLSLSRPGSRSPPRPRIVLPSLIYLWFGCDTEYLEDIVTRIDAPLLNDLRIYFFNEPTFDTPLLRSFISRTEAFEAFNRAILFLYHDCVQVTLVREGGHHKGVLQLETSCDLSNRQISSVARAGVFNSFLPPLPTLEQLHIHEHPTGLHWQDDIAGAQWLELLRPFIAVKNLSLVTHRVTLAVQVLAEERATGVLPALQNIFVDGPVPRGISQFIAARQLLGRPVAVQDSKLGEAWVINY